VAWKAEPRATRGGQPRYSALAITTALDATGGFSAWRYARPKGWSRSLLRLLGLDLAAPDHSTMRPTGRDIAGVATTTGQANRYTCWWTATGLKLCGPGEWLVEKHATRTRRSWRKLHIGVDADTGQIIAAELTSKDVG